jgi:glucose/arabinose dehydrogenase
MGARDKYRRMLRHVLAMAVAFWLAACSGGGGSEPLPAETTAQSAAPQPAALPAAAAVSVKLEVPSTLASAPFDAEHSLTIPPGFGIRVWSRVPDARFMALAPNGDVLVSMPNEGRIVLLRERSGDTPQQFDFATGLRKPHDMVFHTIDNVTWLYVAESNRISRTVYEAGKTGIGAREIVVDNLPDSLTPGLEGDYSHDLKNIAIGPDDKLYVSVGSTCNACASDAQANFVLGAIYQYGADGKGGRLFARGLRNAEGLDFIPGTNTLWATVNSRDEIPVPFDIDVDGDGKNDFGRVVNAYVDNNPVDFFTQVRDGGNYGWPYCDEASNGTASVLAPDYDTNLHGERFDCTTADRASKAIRAHSAPLGMSFLHNTAVPSAYRKGAAVAEHGCWNCSALVPGYRVSFFPFDDAGNAGGEMDLITGFVIDPQARKVWGRPVDVIADAKGNLLISDDYAGAIYQLYPK